MAKLSKEEIKKIKLQAENEFKKEQAEVIVEKLKMLYERESAALKVAANIRREIEDYEMQLEE